MKIYTAAKLAEIINKHGKWLRDEDGGYRANLSYADLSYADLRGANLRGADLSCVSSLCGAVGNMLQVKSVQCDIWPVTYTDTLMQIGCRLHAISDWWAFGDEEIAEMDIWALTWWSIWKPILKNMIYVSPAVAGKAEAEQ